MDIYLESTVRTNFVSRKEKRTGGRGRPLLTYAPRGGGELGKLGPLKWGAQCRISPIWP